MTLPKYAVWEDLKKSEREKKIALQKKYCEDHKVPLFCDLERCPSCNQEFMLYIKEREAENKHITGCPLCDCSFCD